jgi:hypothetical protein
VTNQTKELGVEQKSLGGARLKQNNMCGLISDYNFTEIPRPAATVKRPKCHYCKVNDVIPMIAPYCSIVCRDMWATNRKVELDKMMRGSY